MGTLASRAWEQVPAQRPHFPDGLQVPKGKGLAISLARLTVHRETEAGSNQNPEEVPQGEGCRLKPASLCRGLSS